MVRGVHVHYTITSARMLSQGTVTVVVLSVCLFVMSVRAQIRWKSAR